jgi:thiamine-phosphate pyrophosphorylase
LPSDPRARLTSCRLYLCTDARRHRGDLGDFLDAVLAAGVDAVQLREKNLEARVEMELARPFATAAEKYGALWSVNDRADLAVALRPDILHLGQEDLPTSVARAVVGEDMLIGRSTHSRDEVDAAAFEDGVDYFCVGPVWPTPTKPGRPAPGLDLIRYAASLGIDRPWFAIGGIDLSTLDEVLDAGARRVVVVRAITEAPDPAAAVQEFVRRLTPS